MSSAIPFHFLISSYSDEKLIHAEKDYYQKLEDFSKVFCDKLADNSITTFDYPFYRRYLNVCDSDLSSVRDVMYNRKLYVPKREIAKHIIACFEAVKKTGFNWAVE